MTKAEAIRYFKTKYAISKVLGIHRSAVGRWGRIVPMPQAYKLWKLSGGQVQMREDHYA